MITTRYQSAFQFSLQQFSFNSVLPYSRSGFITVSPVHSAVFSEDDVRDGLSLLFRSPDMYSDWKSFIRTCFVMLADTLVL